jgi:hypothetical protein
VEGGRGRAALLRRGRTSPPPRLEGCRPSSPPTQPPGSGRQGTRGGKRDGHVCEARMSEEPVAPAGLLSSGWETMASRSGGPVAGAVRAASSSCSSSSICRPGGAVDSSSMHWKQGQAGESTTGREWRRRIQTLRLAPLLRLAPPPQLLEVNDEIRGVRKRRRSAREVAATRISSVVGTSSVGEQLRGNGKQRRRREQLGAWGSQAVGMGKAPDTPPPVCSTTIARCKLQQLLWFLLEPLQCQADLHFADAATSATACERRSKAAIFPRTSS